MLVSTCFSGLLALCLISTTCSLPVNEHSDKKAKTQFDHVTETKAADWVSLEGFSKGNKRTEDWSSLAKADIERTLAATKNTNRARNVIVFIGDGMGVSSVTAARIYHAQTRNLTGNDALLAWEKFTETGAIMTYSTTNNVPDSAATATAILCGEKTSQGVIGINQKVAQGDCPLVAGNELTSVAEHGQKQGKWTGIAVTSRVTHATPASFFGHGAHRYWEADEDIPEEHRDTCTDFSVQLLESELHVALGGGRRMFYPKGNPDPERPDNSGDEGDRLDGRLLTDEWIEEKSKHGTAHYVMDLESFNNVDATKTDYLLGLFEPSHMNYEVDRNNPEKEKWGEPSLSEMVEKAINVLEKGPEGYMLLVEGSRIDHAHHASTPHKAVTETVALSDAVRKATEMTNESDTLIIVTSDHSHPFVFNGYGTINDDILGLAHEEKEDGSKVPVTMADGLPYLALSYTNGPGYYYHRSDMAKGDDPRRDLTDDENIGGTSYLADAAMPIGSSYHAGEEVLVYASGPGSFLFRGVHEQSYIAHAINYAACIGDFSEGGLCKDE